MDDSTLGRILEVLGDGGGDEEWTCPNDGYVDYYALVVFEDASYIFHQDNGGFKSYDVYGTEKEARLAWWLLVDELEAEYAEVEA